MDTKMHFFKIVDKKMRYICNEACGVSKNKATSDYNEVTCNNCKKMLDKERKEILENAAIKGLLFKIDQEKTALKKYISVLVKYAFVETCTASTFYEDLFTSSMFHGSDAIHNSKLPQSTQNELMKDVYGNIFAGGTERERLESNLAHYKRLVSWAKTDLGQLSEELKTKIIKKSIDYQDAWIQQSSRNDKVYKKITEYKK